MVYTVTFNPAVDYIVHTKQLIAGATNRSDSEEIYFGGKGINVSIVLSELGVNSPARLLKRALPRRGSTQISST